MSAVQRLSSLKYTRGSSPAKRPYSEPKLEKIYIFKHIKKKKNNSKLERTLASYYTFENFRLLLDFRVCVFC